MPSRQADSRWGGGVGATYPPELGPGVGTVTAGSGAGVDTGAGTTWSLAGAGTARTGAAGRAVRAGAGGDGSAGRAVGGGVTASLTGSERSAPGTTVAGTVARKASGVRLIREKTLTLSRRTITPAMAATNVLHRLGRRSPTGSGVVPASHCWKKIRS